MHSWFTNLIAFLAYLLACLHGYSVGIPSSLCCLPYWLLGTCSWLLSELIYKVAFLASSMPSWLICFDAFFANMLGCLHGSSVWIPSWLICLDALMAHLFGCLLCVGHLLCVACQDQCLLGLLVAFLADLLGALLAIPTSYLSMAAWALLYPIELQWIEIASMCVCYYC